MFFFLDPPLNLIVDAQQTRVILFFIKLYQRALLFLTITVELVTTCDLWTFKYIVYIDEIIYKWFSFLYWSKIYIILSSLLVKLYYTFLKLNRFVPQVPICNMNNHCFFRYYTHYTSFQITTVTHNGSILSNPIGSA